MVDRIVLESAVKVDAVFVAEGVSLKEKARPRRDFDQIFEIAQTRFSRGSDDDLRCIALGIGVCWYSCTSGH